jgi:hypothetical protein
MRMHTEPQRHGVYSDRLLCASVAPCATVVEAFALLPFRRAIATKYIPHQICCFCDPAGVEHVRPTRILFSVTPLGSTHKENDQCAALTPEGSQKIKGDSPGLSEPFTELTVHSRRSSSRWTSPKRPAFAFSNCPGAIPSGIHCTPDTITGASTTTLYKGVFRDNGLSASHTSRAGDHLRTPLWNVHRSTTSGSSSPF